MSLFASVLVLLLVSLYAADALPSGAPAGACASVAPSPGADAHGSTVQTDPPPYVLDLSVFDVVNGAYQYDPGRTYTLTFRGVEATFRGFFVRTALAADATSFVTDATFATISGQDYTRISNCTPATSGITHNNIARANLTQVQFSWTAPPGGTGPILFRYAVVQTRFIYWADQRSDTVSGGAALRASGVLLSGFSILLAMAAATLLF